MQGRVRMALVLLAVLGAGSPALGEDLECPDGARLEGEAPPRGVKQWCVLEDGTQQGPSVFWFSFGRKRVEANFCKGRLCGVYRQWWDNGQLEQEGAYEDDQKHGAFTEWDPDGTVRVFQEYRKGVIHGNSKTWWQNGQPMLELTYVNGEQEGPALTWFETGRKKTEGSFRKGRQHGTWTAWYPDGTRRKVAVFDEGEELSREHFPPAGSDSSTEVENQ